MVFSSLQFIFLFLPIFLAVYFIISSEWKNAWIFAASMVFYGVGTIAKPQYVLLLFLSVIVNFLIGKILSARHGKKHKIIFLIGILYNLAWLCMFKYSDFIIENIAAFAKMQGSTNLPQPWNFIMPLGISFYTFKNISYLADVYQKKIEAETSFVNYGVYLTMFPQLISGPIERYSQMQERLTHRHISFAGLDAGLKQFTIGLGLKMLLADRIGSCWNDIQTIGFDSISAPVAWMGIFAYSFQLYFDFYGYTLMATGIGTMMGFKTPDNFSHPYESLSMTEFWRRWHMTLGSWFRDYVYIPLGGNRKAVPRVYLNLFIVWLLTGIWHGAGWNFILWGVLLFAVIAVEKAGLKKKLDARPAVGHLYMLFLIPLSWMIFAITDIGQLGVYVTRLVDVLGTGSDTVYAGDFAKFTGTYGILMLVCLIFCTSLPKRIFSRVQDTLLGSVVLFFLFWASVYLIYLGLSDPFMYFRF